MDVRTDKAGKTHNTSANLYNYLHSTALFKSYAVDLDMILKVE